MQKVNSGYKNIHFWQKRVLDPGWKPVFTKLGKKQGFCAAAGVATPEIHWFGRRDALVKKGSRADSDTGVATARATRQWRRDVSAQAARVFFRVLSNFTPFLTHFKLLTHESSAKHDKEHENDQNGAQQPLPYAQGSQN